MYKVSRELLVKITKSLDELSQPPKKVDLYKDKKSLIDAKKRFRAQYISKLIKSNYTEIKP